MQAVHKVQPTWNSGTSPRSEHVSSGYQTDKLSNKEWQNYK